MRRTQILLTDEARRLLDAESARTGRSISELIRDAIAQTYSNEYDSESDLAAIEGAFGAWGEREPAGAIYVTGLRSGGRLVAAVQR